MTPGQLCGQVELTAIVFLRRARNVTMPKPAANSGKAAGIDAAQVSTKEIEPPPELER